MAVPDEVVRQSPHPARLRFAVVAIICGELMLRRKYTNQAEPAADIERLS
jgi:hypothetical protein